MTLLKVVNERNEGDKGYAAFYMGKQVALYASSLLDAKERAIEYYKPTKKMQHMITVLLIQTEDGDEYVQTPQ